MQLLNKVVPLFLSLTTRNYTHEFLGALVVHTVAVAGDKLTL